MKRKRKNHTAEFKAKVALAALKGDKTTNEVASAHDVHPTLVNQWKRQLLDNASAAFAGAGQQAAAADTQALQAPLFEKIGRLEMELDWLKKKAASLG
jgi:transposase-like protein